MTDPIPEHDDRSKEGPMPFRKRETAEHAKQQQRFKDIERSLKDAADLLVSSKHEIERSRRILKDTDLAVPPAGPPVKV
jgi:hypothetical protein